VDYFLTGTMLANYLTKPAQGGLLKDLGRPCQ